MCVLSWGVVDGFFFYGSEIVGGFVCGLILVWVCLVIEGWNCSE